MEFVDQVKSMLGIGAPTITFEGVERTARAGDVIRGVVVLVSGDHEVSVEDLALHFDEQQQTYISPTAAHPPERQTVRRLVEAKIELGGRALASGERLERAFELRLPADLEPSEGMRCYAVVAECEVLGQNPVAELPVVIAP